MPHGVKALQTSVERMAPTSTNTLASIVPLCASDILTHLRRWGPRISPATISTVSVSRNFLEVVHSLCTKPRADGFYYSSCGFSCTVECSRLRMGSDSNPRPNEILHAAARWLLTGNLSRNRWSATRFFTPRYFEQAVLEHLEKALYSGRRLFLNKPSQLLTAVVA